MALALAALGVVLGLSVVLTVLWPLFEAAPSSALNETGFREYERLHQERERLMENIQDLELDKTLHKIDEADYQQLKKNLILELSRLYELIDRREKSDVFLKKVNQEIDAGEGRT